jgi:hypothetical protein
VLPQMSMQGNPESDARNSVWQGVAISAIDADREAARHAARERGRRRRGAHNSFWELFPTQRPQETSCLEPRLEVRHSRSKSLKSYEVKKCLTLPQVSDLIGERLP